MTNIEIIDKLNRDKSLTHGEWVQIMSTYSSDDKAYANSLAQKISIERFGKEIFIRGIVEFSNICKNDCFYCGIRKSNSNANRYRLTAQEILGSCDEGYKLGFRTFVLQGGEDGFFSADILGEIVREIKAEYSDCAVTLSVGEMSFEDYKHLFECGANRYLLRHETASEEHYKQLHPSNMSWKNRMECLENLKEIGYQTGCGMMVGSPFQTADNLANDMEFLSQFKPHMVGIGPFLPHKDTPFKDFSAGSYDMTLMLISLCRIMLPSCLIPATTALGTINPQGREQGVLAGANVIMPNLSPLNVRKKYLLYDNKICTGDESAKCVMCLGRRMNSIGYNVNMGKGDYIDYD